MSEVLDLKSLEVSEKERISVQHTHKKLRAIWAITIRLKDGLWSSPLSPTSNRCSVEEARL